jgi:hypothetical protein
MKAQGYTAEQRERLMGKLGDGKIWNIIKTYGPIVLQIFIKYILPLLLALEQPQGTPDNTFDMDEMEQFMMSAEIPDVDDDDERD